MPFCALSAISNQDRSSCADLGSFPRESELISLHRRRVSKVSGAIAVRCNRAGHQHRFRLSANLGLSNVCSLDSMAAQRSHLVDLQSPVRLYQRWKVEHRLPLVLRYAIGANHGEIRFVFSDSEVFSSLVRQASLRIIVPQRRSTLDL